MKLGGFWALGRNLSAKEFILYHLIILSAGLFLLGGLYYILNIQYQKPAKSFANGPITTAPKSFQLDLKEPEKDIISYSKSLAVSGKTGPAREILIYTDTNDLVIRSGADGTFGTKVELDEGENNITVVVFDSKGQSRETQRTVFYSKEKL